MKHAALLLLLACGSSSTPTPSPTPASAPTKPPPADDDAKWRCASDGDCMTSCSQGAVNRDWYKNAHVHECKDGCEDDGAAAPRCIDKQCVAFREGPGGTTKRDPGCTHRVDR